MIITENKWLSSLQISMLFQMNHTFIFVSGQDGIDSQKLRIPAIALYFFKASISKLSGCNHLLTPMPAYLLCIFLFSLRTNSKNWQDKFFTANKDIFSQKPHFLFLMFVIFINLNFLCNNRILLGDRIWQVRVPSFFSQLQLLFHLEILYKVYHLCPVFKLWNQLMHTQGKMLTDFMGVI